MNQRGIDDQQPERGKGRHPAEARASSRGAGEEADGKECQGHLEQDEGGFRNCQAILQGA